MADAFAGLARRRIDEHVAMVEMLREDGADFAAAVSSAILASLRAGGKVVLFGNGGSAADAQHIAAEYVGRFYLERRALPAMALNVNASAITAIGNDYSYPEIFTRQLEAFGAAGDVVIGLSTSGNSPNVLRALEAARAGGMVAVGMTGAGGGQILAAAEHCLRVPSDDTPRIQEGHLLINHVICELVEADLFAPVAADDPSRLAS